MNTEKTSTDNNTPKNKKRFKGLRIFGWIMLSILLVLLALVAFIRSEWGQSIIVEKAVNYVANKTNTKVALDRAFVGFDGDIIIEGLFLEDKNGDTLVYSKSLEADIPLWPIINGKGIGVEALDWEGLRANIHREDTINGYNFQFLVDAFATNTPTTQVQDTTAAPLDIIIGNIALRDINVDFNDAVLGIESKFVLNELRADMETTDLENMVFKANDILFDTASITYIQSPVAVNPDESAAPLPILSADNLAIKNTQVAYKDVGAGMAASLNIQDFSASLPTINLKTSTFNLDHIYLANSEILIHTNFNDTLTPQTATPVAIEEQTEAFKFAWPEVTVTLPEIEIANTNITYKVANAQLKKETFNPNFIALNSLNFKAEDIALKNKLFTTDIAYLNFKEASGLHLSNLALNTRITNTETSVTNFNIRLNQNLVRNAQVKLNYKSIDALIDNPALSNLNVNIPKFQLDIDEVIKFQPDLSSNQYINTLSEKLLTGTIKANGSLSSITIPSATLNWGNNTTVSATAIVNNAMEPENLDYKVSNFKATTLKKDVLQFVDEKNLGVNLPETVTLKGYITGTTNKATTNLNLLSSQGTATLSGSFNFNGAIVFDTNITIDAYNVGDLLQNPEIGKLSLQVDAKGNGNAINTLNATAAAVITNFTFKEYAINDLKIEGNFKEGNGNISSNYKNKNLNVDLASTIVLDSIATKASVYLNVIGADLQALGLMQRDVKTGLKLAADFEGTVDNFDVITTIGDGVVVYDNNTYLLGDVLATAHIRQDTTSIWLNNKLLDLTLESNSNPQQFSKAITNHISSYFSRDAFVADTITNPVALNLKATVRQAPILNEVFLVNLQDLDTVAIAVNFKEDKRQLMAAIDAPHIHYSGMELDSLAFTMDTNAEAINFNLGFNEIIAGPLNIKRTIFKGKQENNKLNLDFIAFDEAEKLIQIKTETTGNSDQLRFHVQPDSLIIQKKPWITPADNEVVITKDAFNFNNFNFSRNNQSISFVDNLQRPKKHIAIDFKNFQLAEILNYLNPDKEFAKGTLTGQIIVEEPLGTTGLVADFDVSNLQVLDVNLGTLTVDANATGGNTYDFQALLKGGDIDLDFTGDYIAKAEGATLDVNLDINRFNMKALEGFTLGEIKDTEGSFNGNFSITGTPAAPKYKGALNFNNATFKIAALNTGFTFPSEILKIDNTSLQMSNFKIKDENGNTLVVDGNVGTKSFLNPTFNLKIDATNFQVINATKEDNDLVYGQAQFDATATIKGDLQIPIVNVTATIDENTNLTYVMPAATVNVEERDGVVMFVNRENPDAILTRTEEQTATFTGFDIEALIKVGENAKVTIVIDENTGDNFKVYGKGDFDFTMNPNGRMTLTGAYDVLGGAYEMSLYNLVKRKFELDPSSRVSWAGDPFDAKLDVRAIYNVEASAAPLMAGGGVSSLSPQERQRFKQVLPFNVYLNVDGQLLQPEISFGLDMPEDEQGAIGGQVYGRVQQINQQDGELNRQVFSLLVLNRFYPEGSNDGSQGGVASIARDNLNDALSDQLNVIGDKILGGSGVELDFGLNSYTDYQGDAPQERTQLEIAARKKLFNDRLIVSVGSDVDIQGSNTTDEATPLIGNVSLEYILSENGRYRLKGFRRNEFENVIDGQTIVSGIALIFTQEFNQFSELWDALLRSQKEEDDKDQFDAKKDATDTEKIKNSDANNN